MNGQTGGTRNQFNHFVESQTLKFAGVGRIVSAGGALKLSFQFGGKCENRITNRSILSIVRHKELTFKFVLM